MKHHVRHTTLTTIIIAIAVVFSSNILIGARSHLHSLPFTNTQRRNVLIGHNHHRHHSTTTTTTPAASSLSTRFSKLSSSRTSSILWQTRGGGSGGSPNEYDDYDDEYYDEYDPLPPSSRPPSRSPPTRPNTNGQTRRPPPPRGYRPPPRKPSALDQTSHLAKKTLALATSTTMKSIVGTGKAAYYLTSPKFVSHDEVIGVWRLDQVLNDDTGGDACSANVQLTSRGDVVVHYGGKGDENEGKDEGGGEEEERRTVYYFRSRSWPRSCTIEFEAGAFQGPDDVRPVVYYYRGVFRRKIADRSVVKIVGKIYEMKRRGRFRKGGGPGAEVGSFVGRRRMSRFGSGGGGGYRGERDAGRNEDVYDVEQDDTDGDAYDSSDEYEDSFYDDEEEYDDEEM